MLTLIRLAVKLGIIKVSSILRNAGSAVGVNGRTVGGGVILLLMGVIGALLQAFPELTQMVPRDVDYSQYLEYLSGGLIGIGVAGKFEKNRSETAALNNTLTQLVEILGGNAKITQQMVQNLSKYAEAKIEKGDDLK